MNDQSNNPWLSEHLRKADQRPIDLDALIARLAGQQAHFSRYIDRRWDDLDPRQLARLLSTHGQNADRLGRLMRDRCALYGRINEELEELIARSLEDCDDEPPDHGPSAHDDDASPPPIIDVDDVITDLADKQARLFQLLDPHWRDPDAEHPGRLLAVYSHNAARLGRLLRRRCAIYGQPADELLIIIDAALESVGQQLGIDLTGRKK
jgi:hypothetical protein